jgi:methionyl-tRNA formyltransferase
MKLHEPPVKVAARELGLEVYQPLKVRTGELEAWLRERKPDVAVVLAYGRILPPPVLSAPRLGCINLHASLLPRHRGAAPIQWAILEGDRETGISLMQMDEGMDTGPVFTTRVISISDRTTAGELTEALAELAATLIREDLPRACAGEFALRAQDHARATHAPPIEREHTLLDFTTSALSLARRVRAFAPQPGAQTSLGGKLFKVLEATPAGELDASATAPVEGAPTEGLAGAAPASPLPGTVCVGDDHRVFIVTGDGHLELHRAQLEGRKPLPIRDLVNGRALTSGMVLGR